MVQLPTLRSLLLVASYPAPFDQDSEDPRETALCSDPIGMVGRLQAECFGNLLKGFGIGFAIGQSGKHGLMAHYNAHIFILQST